MPMSCIVVKPKSKSQSGADIGNFEAQIPHAVAVAGKWSTPSASPGRVQGTSIANRVLVLIDIKKAAEVVSATRSKRVTPHNFGGILSGCACCACLRVCEECGRGVVLGRCTVMHVMSGARPLRTEVCFLLGVVGLLFA